MTKFALGFGLMLALLLARPLPADRTHFDERFFLDDAAALRAGRPPVSNTEHPPFGKRLMAWAATATGDGLAAGRLTAALGAATLAGLVFAFGAPTGFASGALAAGLTALDPVILTTGRLTNLDGLAAAAYLAAVWLLVRALDRRRALSVSALAGALFAAGVALGVKWAALTLLPLAVGLALLRVDDWAAIRVPWASAAIGLLALAAGYYGTYAASGFGPGAFAASQAEILTFHTYYYQVPRHLTASWTDWITLTGACWYAVEYAAGQWRVFAAVATPLWLLTLPAAGYALATGLRRRDARRAALGMAVVLQLVMWALARRQTMIYYMTAVAPFVYLAAAGALADFARRRPRAVRAAVAGLVLAAAGYFAVVEPLTSFRPFGPRRAALFFESPLRRLVVNRAMDLEALRGGTRW